MNRNLSNKTIPEYLHKHTKEDNCAYNFFVPEGWNSLVKELHENLLKLNPKYTVVQVKEKFGQLRFYLYKTSEDDKTFNQMSNLTFEYMKKSSKVCDQCGEPGILRTKNGVLATRCDKHLSY